VAYTVQEGSDGTSISLALHPAGKLLAPRIVGRMGSDAPGENMDHWEGGSALSGSYRDFRLSLTIMTREKQESRVSGYISYYPDEERREPGRLEGAVYCTAQHMDRLARFLSRYGDSTEWSIQVEGSEPLLHFLSDYVIEPFQKVAVRELAAMYEFSKAEDLPRTDTAEALTTIQRLVESIDNHLRAGVRIRIF
jgi:hypothetical protein